MAADSQQMAVLELAGWAQGKQNYVLKNRVLFREN
jgi:hypothetical protein